jgi:hypothetical protein
MPTLNPARALTSLIPEAGPRRVYLLSVLVNTFGTGLIYLCLTLYLIKVVHLSHWQAGFGLAIAGVVGVVTGIPVGDLADRRGPREMVVATMCVQGITTFCYLFIQNFGTFVLVAVVDLLAMNANQAANGALLRRVGGEGAAAFRSSTVAVANLGISIGALGAAVAVQIDTPDAYRALLFVDALTFVAGAAVLLRLPRYEPLPKPAGGPRWQVLRDMPFVAYTAANGAMFIQAFVLILLLPVWIVDYTSAPRWSISMFLLVNTLLVILFQVSVGKRVTTFGQGGLALRQAGFLFLISCSVLGFAAGLPGWAALLVLLGAVLVHTYGELWHTAGTFALNFGLPPEHAQGQYMGLVGIGNGVGGAAAPVILLGVCLSLGRAGFIGLGVCFALLGLTAPALARWGERTRQAAPQPPASPAATAASSSSQYAAD